MAYFGRAKGYFDRREYEAAVRELTTLLEEEPENEKAWRLLAACHFAQRDYAEAEAPLRRCTELAPLDPAVWTNLGLVLRKQERWEDARRCLLYALSLDPQSVQAREELEKVNAGAPAAPAAPAASGADWRPGARKVNARDPGPPAAQTEQTGDQQTDKCPSCGARWDGQARVCWACGAVRPDIAAERAWRERAQEEAQQELHRQMEEARRQAARWERLSRTRQCPDCGGTISVRARACPHCGAGVVDEGATTAVQTTSLVLGVLCWLVICIPLLSPLCALIAVVLGAVGTQPAGGRSLAVVGIVLGALNPILHVCLMALNIALFTFALL